MKRTGIALSIVTLTFVGAGLFQVAQNVRDSEGELKTLNAKIESEQETIHTLQAEWFYLNQPARLEKIAHKHTDLKPINEKNLIALNVVPLMPEKLGDSATEEEIIAQPVNKATGYESYISKTNQKTRLQTEKPALPIHNVSLRDIWGQ